LFIPMAEETGLIVPLGQWALEHACQTLAQWKQQMPRHAESLTMNVNVSRRQFDSAGFVQHIASVLERTALPPSALKIEITESLIAHDPLATARVVAQLKAMGVGLVIDDFGTGSSSLGNLHSYPLEGLKIDRSFISHASLRRDYAAVINSIVDLARNLGMTVVAEGVETREQSVLLQALGCELAQGFLFARPLPAGDAAAFIAAHALPAASAAA
ncbi:MAG TPA: EAL domain-containing protein, partial [Tepidisphaeraceae bacterium]|nr:EAL domain-containing protein [Tepidisphaeraceae bacterium]